MTHADPLTSLYARYYDLIVRMERQEVILRLMHVQPDKHADPEYSALWVEVMTMRTFIWDLTGKRPPVRTAEM